MLRFAVFVGCSVICICCTLWADEKVPAVNEGNRLAYLDECNPWYPDKDFPKLITPQWVGEEGVEAVIVLAIDDMRDPAKYEQHLRPILNRLKQIDGRAPVSIMTNEVKPNDPQLQSWLGEGLSIECHSIDHPCPILQGGDFDQAKSTYDRCVDLMGQIPGNKPVAFRTPCCDSLNTVSPRFFSEVFNSTTKDGNFLQIDSSVFTFFTSEDESLPKELVLDANGKERFWKYLPKNNNYGGNVHNNFVNYIKNYPYPYLINNSCWEIPCIAPSDWSAQHLHGVNNPVTVEDWKAAIDLTVHKQGCFSLVFHPHGWISAEQVVEMIDHAVAKHGKKVKFLNFAEVAEKLNSATSNAAALRTTTDRSPFFPKSRPSTYVDLPKEIVDIINNAPSEAILPIQRENGTNNGFFIHDRHFCWINEDTATLPDLMYRVSFDEILAAHEKPQASGGRQPSGTTAENVANAPEETTYRGADAAPLAEYEPVPIGAAVIDITPEYPVRLTGYGNRLKESEGVAAKIHARALVIGGRTSHSVSSENQSPLSPVDPLATPTIEPTGERARVRGQESNAEYTSKTHSPAAASSPLIRPPATFSPDPGGEGADAAPLAVLITVDNCGVPIEITETVFAKISAKHGLARERFAISSTHSHSGPWLRDFAPNIFTEVPEEHAAHLAQYETDLIEKLVEVVDKAIASCRPGHLSYGFGEAGFAMNRRALTNGKWTGFGEAPDGPTDKRVPVLAAHDVDGKLIAVLANYACHCTTETGEFNQISGDWAGFAADMLEADHPGAVALIAIGCGADANPSPRGTHDQAKVHGRTMADEVGNVLASGGGKPSGTPTANPSDQTLPGSNRTEGLTPSAHRIALHRINPSILCNMARIDLPLGPVPNRAEWEEFAKLPGVEGSRAKYFLNMLDDGQQIPTTIPNYPVQTWCFGEDLGMVFLGGEVVVDYSIRLNDMLDGDRLWINSYSNDVPCYIASARVLREGGYECDSSMLYYRRPTRLSPEAEDVLCDAVQKIMPHEFYSEKLQQDFPAPKSPEESLKCMTTKPDMRVVLAASEPLIRDPVAFDWDERGRLWVVEMGDYPKGPNVAVTLRRDEPTVAASDSITPIPESQVADQAQLALANEGGNSGAHHAERDGYIGGRIRMLEDTDKDGVYDKATTFLDGLEFPNGIHCWRGGVIVTMAPDIFYAEDTDGDGKADVRETMYKGFVEGNQQHRVNGLRWGLDGWLYLANGDSGGEIAGTGFIPSTTVSGGRQPSGTSAANRTEGLASSAGQSASLRGRDLRINPDTNELDTVSGQTQFGRERDDFGNWFGNNNSNPIWQYVLEDRYVRRNPHAGISQVIAQVSVIPGAAPVYPTSRTLARFNEFASANRFTSACSTMIYRDSFLGERYHGNAFTSEPVHNLVSRLVLTRDGYGFKGERAADEQESEFLASSDNWFRPTMIRTGPDGALWVADMYRAVIEHPEWIPPEYQRKMNLYAGNDRGRIYRIVPAGECCGENSASGGRQPTGTLTANRTGGLTPHRSLDDESDVVASADGSENSTSITAEREEYSRSRLPSGTFAARRTESGMQPGATDERERDLRRPESGVATSLVAGRSVAAKSLPSERTYFDQRWNEIPIADLITRLESPNGWWRDTVQQILVHRHDELLDVAAAVERVRILANSNNSPEVTVQAMALLATVARDAESLEACIVQGMGNESPTVRREAVKLLESLLEAGDTVTITKLTALAADPDLAVRLQLMLSLGEAKGNSGAKLLGQMMRENFDDLTLRNAGLTSLTPENVSGVLYEALNVPADQLNEELIGILLGQAAAMGKDETLGEPLTRLVKSIDDEAAAARFDLIAEVLRKTLRSDAASKLKLLPEFKTILNNSGETAMIIARNALADPDRRAAALRFADVVGVVDPAAESFADYLGPQSPNVLQIAAVNIVVRNGDEASIKEMLASLNTFAPAVRSAVLTLLLQRDSTIEIVLDAVAAETLTDRDFDATELDAMLNHRNEQIATRAKSLLSGDSVSSRAAIIDDFRSQMSNLKSEISNEEQITAGKLVFEKRCGTCHKLQDIGKDVGADLAALKDRSTEALLTAVLDPNRAVESKFLMYTVVTKDGLQYSGMLKGETGGGLTLIGSEGKEFTVARADIDELVASKRSLMPEGLEKDLSARDLANVIAFVQSTETPWKRFDGNSPQFVKPNSDGTITLPASSAEIYGPNLAFEQKYGNLGFWSSTDDYTKWTFEVPKSGHWTVEFDFACDDSTAGSLVKLSTGNRLLSARVPGTGTWDHYQTWQAGTIDLHGGRGQLIVTAPENLPMALMDLRAIRLIPPK